MPVPLPRSRALWFVLSVAFALLAAWRRTRWRTAAARCTRRPTTPAATPCSGSTAHPTARCRPRAPSRPAAPASPTSAGARAPSSSAATAATCTRSTRLRQRLGVPRRGPPADLVGSFAIGGVAPASIAEHAAASTCSTPAGRRASPPSPAVRRLARADPRRHARARARRRGRRAGLGHARRPLARGQRTRRQPARDAAARSHRAPRRAGRDRLERHGAVRLRDHAAGHARRVGGGGEHRLVVPPRRAGRAPHHLGLAAGRPGRGLLGRGVAERAVRLHGQRQRQHQRVRDQP